MKGSGDLMYKVTQSPLRVQIVFDFCDSDFVFPHTSQTASRFPSRFPSGDDLAGSGIDKNHLNLMRRSELEKDTTSPSLKHVFTSASQRSVKIESISGV
jgi:hypothetical protein